MNNAAVTVTLEEAIEWAAQQNWYFSVADAAGVMEFRATDGKVTGTAVIRFHHRLSIRGASEGVSWSEFVDRPGTYLEVTAADGTLTFRGEVPSARG